MHLKKRMSLILLDFILISMAASVANSDAGDNFNADSYLYWISANVEKNTFNLNETIPLNGVIKRANVSNVRSNVTVTNHTDYYAVSENFTANISILNASTNNSYSLLSQVLVNTTSEGIIRSKSSNYLGATPIYAPATVGAFVLRVGYTDASNSTYNKVDIQFNVLSKAIDKVFLSTDKSKYSAGDNVVVSGSTWIQAGDSLVPVTNVSLNGTLRKKQGDSDLVLSSFSCITGSSGYCSANFSVSAAGKYLVEINGFIATSYFEVVPYDVSVYIKDSTGTSFKEILTTNEQASVEVKVTKNGSTANGTFVFNGTIIDAGGNVIVNITSTKLNDTNGFVNRFQFTTGNGFSDGSYKASVNVYEDGGSIISSSALFNIKSWTMYIVKASGDSGFEYEYSAFPGRNITFEIYPKERANGTLIADANYTHFNIVLYNSLRQVLSLANASLNSSCGSQGCYKFLFTSPNVSGSYIVSVSMNYSGVVQNSERTIKVTDMTPNMFPSTQQGELKELFSTSEFTYLSLTLKNITSDVNITNVTLGNVAFENGTVMNYTRVNGWGDVNSNNSILEWAFNVSVGRIMMDTPKQGGVYSVTVFMNNNSASSSATFTVNPYDACASSKNSAGSVDSSSSWYVWQYKTTDTVYVELRLTRAENPAGRAKADNSSAFSSQYGMGQACNIDTTKKQVITNATITVEKVVNAQTGNKQALNATATLCSADNDQGQYTCTLKPERRWEGGRELVYLKIIGPDGQTSDKAVTIFEARSFYIWAYANNNAWVQKPVSNISFNVRLYEAGSNWWSNWYSNSNNGGITGSVTVEKINYMGDYGEWIWPPIDYRYNNSGINSSNISSGWGSFTIYHDKTPKTRWQTGAYSVTIKGTNDATGDIDYGEAWFNVRQWEAYSSPIESGTYNYKDAFSSKENISLYVRIYNAGNYNDNGGASLNGNVTIGVKKMQFYQSGSYKEVNSSLYSVSRINVNVSSPWYWSASDTYKGHILNISRVSGSWDGGWYNLILDINGTETGYGWFNVISFNVDTQPTNASGTYTYTSSGSGPIYFNISTTRNKKSSYSYYSRGDYINTTVKDMVLRTWKSDTWQTVEFNYPEDFSITPMSVNGTAIISVNKSGSWDAGYYYGEVTMTDSENSTSSGYLWFSIQPFRLSASTARYTVDVDSNVSINLYAYQADWGNNNVVPGNYSITSITENMWSGSGYSKATYTNYRPNSSQSFNGSTQLNITPNNNAWSLANSGYRYITISVRDNAQNVSQSTQVSFRAVSVAVSLGTITNQYSISKSQNITLPITLTKAISGSGTVGNLTRIYEWVNNGQLAYDFSVGSCSSQVTGTCMINSTSSGGVNGTVAQNVTIIVPAGGWPEGWHNLNLEFTSATDRSQNIDGGYTWFQAVSPYTPYWYYEDENASWKYTFDTTNNITFRLQVVNNTYGCGNAYVNVTRVEVSYAANNCWSDYCRSYNSYNFTIFNQTASWISASSITVSGNELNCTERRGIRILHNGSDWKKGDYYVRVTVNGSLGGAVLKTWYFQTKDTRAPNATINSPSFNITINGSLFLNITTSESVNCHASLVNYDQFTAYYCNDQKGNSGNGSVDTQSVDYRSCNGAGFNGSTYYYASISRWGISGTDWGSFITGGTTHTFNFSISKLPITQDYGINAWCYDDDWNMVNRRVAFRVNVSNVSGGGGSSSTNSANVSLLAPADFAAITVGSLLNLSFSVNHSQGTNTSPTKMANCTLYTNFTGAWDVNETRHNMIRFIIGSSNTEQASYNITHSTAGTYKWGVFCNITNVNATWSTVNRSFTLLPNSNISLSINQTEANNTLFTNSSGAVYFSLHFNVTIATLSNLNCSLYTNATGGFAANITNNAITSTTNNQFSFNSTANTTYIWNVYCTNSTQSAWGDNRTIQTIVNNGSSSSQDITVTLVSPSNGTAYSTGGSGQNITFEVNASILTAGTSNCSLYTNYTGSWVSNMTRNLSAAGSQKSNLSINITTNSSFSWNVICGNSTLNAWGSSNLSFSVAVNNVSTINVTLLSPANSSSQASGGNLSFLFNWIGMRTSYADCSLYTNLSSAWALNATYTNIASSLNTTLSLNHSTAGSYKWNVYCANHTDASINAWAPNNFTLTLT